VRPWLELRAHAGIAARAPTLPERFGDRGVIVGNASLRAERSRFVDAAAVLTARRGRWRLDAELGGYARDATDLIALVQVGPGRFRAENFGRVSIVGAELSARVRWRDELTLTVAGALLDPALVGEGGDRGRMVPGVPWGDLSATLAMAVGGARAALSVSAVSSAWLDRSNCTAGRPAPGLVTAGASRMGRDAGGDQPLRPAHRESGSVQSDRRRVERDGAHPGFPGISAARSGRVRWGRLRGSVRLGAGRATRGRPLAGRQRRLKGSANR
jgi:hypothetical protein